MPTSGRQVAVRSGVSEVAGRVRAALEAGYQGQAATARLLLDDQAAAVRSTALGALDRCGHLGAADLQRAVGDRDPGVRRRALDLAARRASRSPAEPPEAPALGAAVRAALADQDPLVAEAACWAVGELGDRTALSVLRELARRHADARVREGAVAAIGAIVADGPDGPDDPDSLQAVVAAAGDKPAVRRRVAVALSAFAGPEATATLEQLAVDRDWQVRQVAEAVLRQ